MVDTFALAEPRQDVRLFALSIRRNQNGHRPADDFIRSVTKHPLRAVVPAPDDSIQVFADNRVVRRFYNRRQVPPDFAGTGAVGDVRGNSSNGVDGPISVSERKLD